MKNLKKSCLILFLIFQANQAASTDIYEDFANALRSGDSKQVGSFFGNTIDLMIMNQEDIYSKAQAELILRDFFNKNVPKSFTIVHKGASQEGTLYGIGTLITSNTKTYRVSFYMKSTNARSVLLELRIEQEP